MPEGKYVVFKTEDWNTIFNCLEEVFELKKESGVLIRGKILDDAVVIRRQDIFAPPALDAYSNSILVSLAMMGPGETKERLKDIASYFHEQAVLSWDTDRKVPD
jgi:hypothetical protein